MKTIGVTIIVLLALSCFTAQADGTSDRELIFTASVMQVGPHPGRDSGDVEVYQLVKYKIIRVCRGDYAGAEIVVDHLALNKESLRGLTAGDKVCVFAKKTKGISLRYNDGVLRSASDRVTFFYMAERTPKEVTACPCS